ncbi:2-hydroxy-6-oxohepta-2,4-dienoate hydrolase [Aliarcobacter butzleri 7h1h]|uniref:2-hydroxy-6-oxohepta-2,4-dienoate hydrolase n=1 Tax=Aliarcobacter butzleri L352 TaxID=1447260 RepID=A0A837JAG7_9BACT|nr:alpha/beta hydrolase [Aliarcobacter butzleri]AGR77043.1 2-hydroxy-6-oxohepta-2,4-dienoate hydrolase [Aliarcobacter butzleri 7h1h]KLE03605.1 2-hydroxy-6-oxohepta-2,4-dienoate hydrolase [Aliarcobacter butzleri L352]MCT7586026.1 alpha/beta hydrolase [Aliarcobacter butzleri]MCT7590620.1 alpha/beta hydrolase [Aliarcobacter butzleri]MCT7647977.1 alpha/beta hydrolase [Aliarcobacter butzleri]
MAIKNIVIDNKIFDISYEIINPSATKDIIFLHGWGSNKDIMKSAFSTYLKDFRHIYIDLPGFGKSPNEYVLTTNDYVNITSEFLKLLHSSKEFIAGHSYGGKVATLLNPQNLILLSSAGILEEKPFDVKLKIFFAKVLNFLGLKNITKRFRSKDVDKMSENMYATFKNVVNEDFSSYFSDFSNKAFIFWGKDDKATSLESGQKIANLIKKSTFEAFEGDHYFFIKKAKNICERIENGIY